MKLRKYSGVITDIGGSFTTGKLGAMNNLEYIRFKNNDGKTFLIENIRAPARMHLFIEIGQHVDIYTVETNRKESTKWIIAVSQGGVIQEDSTAINDAHNDILAGSPIAIKILGYGLLILFASAFVLDGGALLAIGIFGSIGVVMFVLLYLLSLVNGLVAIPSKSKMRKFISQ